MGWVYISKKLPDCSHGKTSLLQTAISGLSGSEGRRLFRIVSGGDSDGKNHCCFTDMYFEKDEAIKQWRPIEMTAQPDKCREAFEKEMKRLTPEARLTKNGPATSGWNWQLWQAAWNAATVPYPSGLQKATVHVLLDTLADAARGEKLDPEICQSIEGIAKEYDHKDFTQDDVQALYDCGYMQPPTDAQRQALDDIEAWQVARATGCQDTEHKHAVKMLKSVKAALQSPAKQSTPEELPELARHPHGILASQIRSCLRGEFESWGKQEKENWVNAIDELITHATRTPEASKADAGEVVTVEDIAMCIQDWKFNEENQQPFFGDYLALKYPNGLRIVKGGAV